MRRLIAIAALVLSTAGCNAEYWIRLAFEEHGPQVQDEAVEVARCESTLRADARNGQYLGLFQLGSYHYWRIDQHGGDWANAFHNAEAASDLYAEQGWRPWSCRP